MQHTAHGVLARSLYRKTLRRALLYSHHDVTKQLALARFAEFIPSSVTLRADGRDDLKDVVRACFRAAPPAEHTSSAHRDVAGEDGEEEGAPSPVDPIVNGFQALCAMNEQETDIALHSLWTSLLVPPRKVAQVEIVGTRSTTRLAPKASAAPTPTTPKAMVRELRAFVLLSVILRWAQLHFKEIAHPDLIQPGNGISLAAVGVAPPQRPSLPLFPTLTHAIHAETKRLTSRVQEDIDGFAREVLARLDAKDIKIPHAVRLALESKETRAKLPPATVDEDAKRIAALRPHLQTVFATILSVVLEPRKSKNPTSASTTPLQDLTAAPRKLQVFSCAHTETSLVEESEAASGDMVNEVRLNCLDTVMESRQSSEVLAAAFVMSVAVRLGLRRTRLVHRPDPTTRRDHFAILVDGPLACEGRGHAVGPLVIDVARRTVLRCCDFEHDEAVRMDAALRDVSDLPFSVPAADRRAAVALLRRVRRELTSSPNPSKTSIRLSPAPASHDHAGTLNSWRLQQGKRATQVFSGCATPRNSRNPFWTRRPTRSRQHAKARSSTNKIRNPARILTPRNIPLPSTMISTKETLR